MQCDDVLVNLPDFLLGKIEPNLKRYIEDHLESCADCREELEELRRPAAVLGGLSDEVYPESFWQEMRASIMESVSAPRRSAWRIPVFAGSLAAFVLLIGFGIYRVVFPPVSTTRSVTALASTLPTDEIVSLPSLNTNYTEAASTQTDGLEEMDAVDDSVQQAVLRSMWTLVADSTGSLDNVDLSSNPIFN